MPQVRRLGSYAPLSSTYYMDDAVIEAGADAELLFARSLAFCASVVSDGYFTEGQLQRFGAGLTRLTKRVDALVAAGLWERAPGGYVIRRWLKWNKSAAEREREKSKDRERKAAQSPGGFQQELGMESEGNPNGTRAGFPSRVRAEAHADGAHHSTSQHITPSHSSSTPPPERPAETHGDGSHDATADELLDSTGPWAGGVRAKHHAELVAALSQGFPPEACKTALVDWRSRANARPKLLPFLIQEAAAHLAPVSNGKRPPWCGECDKATRLVDVGDATAARCPDCHPRSVSA